MVLGELGVTPLLLNAQCRMVMFWTNLPKPYNTPTLLTFISEKNSTIFCAKNQSVRVFLIYGIIPYLTL